MIPTVNIVTGEVNSGKTTRMRALFRRTIAADVILSEKIFDGGRFLGYRLVRLKSGEARTLALCEEAYLGQFAQACRLDRFVFSAEGLRFGIRTLERLCFNPAVGALFLDEVGPLELQGQGFAGVLPQLLRAEKELYITVRSSCLPEFLQKFEITEYRLIQESCNVDTVRIPPAPLQTTAIISSPNIN
ncbi:MAG: hypothetical protein GX592_14955 [Clostridiales bacterium]|nr:hypothetical protein [Clostridiales bacterium]